MKKLIMLIVVAVAIVACDREPVTQIVEQNTQFLFDPNTYNNMCKSVLSKAEKQTVYYPGKDGCYTGNIRVDLIQCHNSAYKHKVAKYMSDKIIEALEDIPITNAQRRKIEHVFQTAASGEIE